ncbi:hypothetical protein V8G54_003899 [Vigna mungo]|uniref:Response regulatory domain-containing protein n=1 Tax=Vigna mungo TaxID=3915 RepID=A0AAQ3PEX0_VIGMU
MLMMDGYEFIQFLNKEEIYVPLILMFFANTVRSLKKAFELGVCYYWLKPLEDFYVSNFWPVMVRHYKERLITKNMNGLKFDKRSDTSGSSECFSDMEVVADDTFHMKDDTLHKKE